MRLAACPRMDNYTQTQPPNETESPRADDMQGAAGLPQTNEDDASARSRRLSAAASTSG